MLRSVFTSYFKPASGEYALNIGQVMVASIITTVIIFTAIVIIGFGLFYL